MKVKVGNKIYDGTLEPVMVILDEEDKLNISHMSSGDMKYLSYLEKMTIEEAKKFMESEEKE